MVFTNIFLFIFNLLIIPLYIGNYFVYLLMDFKEYLLHQKDFTLASLAFRMWPKNKTADNYLSKKLHDKMGLTFTAKDEKLARKALKELGVKLIEVAKTK